MTITAERTMATTRKLRPEESQFDGVECDANIKWIDPAKNYGFITLDNGLDAFVHGTGTDHGKLSYANGQRITCVLRVRASGLFVERMRPSPQLTAPEPEWIAAAVNWYDQRAGYGFVTTRDGRNAFLHATTVKRCGMIQAPQTDDRVRVLLSSSSGGRLAVTRIASAS
jgi:cold shock CspA family protein